MKTEPTVYRRTKKPSIEIRPVSDGDKTVAFYARGRFGSQEFLAAVRQYTGKKPVGRPAYEIWMQVPSENGDLDYLFRKCTPFDKGAFAVTVLNLEDWDR